MKISSTSTLRGTHMNGCELTTKTIVLLILIACLPVLAPAFVQFFGFALAAQKTASLIGLVAGLVGQFFVKC